jgi:hypothetical protein
MTASGHREIPGQRIGAQRLRPPSAHRSTTQVVFARPATATIARIEGNGIWIELNGKLVERNCDDVIARLDRIGMLAFRAVVVDTRQVGVADVVGITVLTDFLHRVSEGGGIVHAIDPNHIWQPILDRRLLGLVTSSDPPAENWWVA